MNLDEFKKSYFGPKVNESLKDRVLQENLLNPIKEFLARPKKGIRADLVRAGIQWIAKDDVRKEDIANLGFVLEALHSGSLIVDDIQDDSPVRREKPSLHILLGVPKALNAGNFLYFWAIKEVSTLSISHDKQIRIKDEIIETLFEGHIGQALDLGSEPSKQDSTEIHDLTLATIDHKTGSLMSLALKVGAIAAGATTDEVRAIDKLGRELGFLLQAYDDLKNYKFNSTDKVINLDEKRFEDFRNERPGFIWAFAASYAESGEFQKLIEATRAFPSLESIVEWMNRNEFHEKSIKLLESREQKFKAQVKGLSEELEKDPSALAIIESLIERIKDAYRNA